MADLGLKVLYDRLDCMVFCVCSVPSNELRVEQERYEKGQENIKKDAKKVKKVSRLNSRIVRVTDPRAYDVTSSDRLDGTMAVERAADNLPVEYGYSRFPEIKTTRMPLSHFLAQSIKILRSAIHVYPHTLPI